MKRAKAKSSATAVQNARKRESNSPAQVWAKQRNFAKYRLLAARATLCNLSSQRFLTPDERNDLANALTKLNMVLNGWSTRNNYSKELYLEEETK